MRRLKDTCQIAWCRRLWRSECALMIAGSLLVLTQSLAGADDMPRPLATCRVQTLPAAPVMTVAAGVTPPTAANLVTVIEANYRRGPTGDWIVPTAVDPDSPRVKLLLVTSSGPLLIHLSVLVDGEAFRKLREQRISEVLERQNSGESDATTSGSELESAASTGLTARQFEQDDPFVRLRKYASQSSAQVSRNEARWLLAQWTPGPDLLELHPRFKADRSHRAPLWVALDADADGVLSSAEITAVRQRLLSLDVDDDGWVEESELTPEPVIDSWATFPLLYVLTDTTDWTALARQLVEAQGASLTAIPPKMNRLLQRLDATRPADLNAERLLRLLECDPDLSLNVRFATTDANDPGLSVVAAADGGLPDSDALSASEDVLSLRMPTCIVEFSAAQPEVTQSGDWNGQVAVGAVIDGSPLLRMVDDDNDRHLSVREIDAAARMVTRLDRDESGKVTMAEMPVPIRLTVTLGPHAHDVLAHSTAMPRPSLPSELAAPPDWFVGMDRNKDGDLSVAEFLGTREQFDQFDVDGNQRISVAEANDSTDSEN